MGKSVARLYEQFQPEHYDLHLVLDPEGMTFSGRVSVQGKKTGRPSERFTFHQNGLNILSASVTRHDKKGDEEVPVSRINNQNKLDEVRVHLGSKVFPGSYTVVLEFEGKITRPMHGIYPCFFKHNGQDKKLLATQFESHHAREAFPCVDEPEAKATYDLTLTTPASLTVIANTPVKEQKQIGSKDGGLTASNDKSSSTTPAYEVTSFETTPRMSSYLLAFVVGEMGYKESKAKNGLTVRAYATPDNVALTDHGLQVAVRGLEYFENYFGVPYPLQKLDIVALPDFTVGAMENWGLITFRETTMLADPKSSSIESKQLIALVVCHELSHQWFGNLVTMKWWEDLWLNESFANMMEYQAVDALYPEWHAWEQFAAHEAVSAKRRDALADVQPVQTAVNHPDEISTLFDPSIVYAKGSCIIYMLKNYLGEKAFRQGLTTYFKKHAYGNTVASDLWAALGEVSGQDLIGFMQKWLTAPGYPQVTLDWQPNAPQMQIKQRRFLSDPEASASDNTPWQVPLAATYKLGDELLVKSAAKISVKPPGSALPLILNHEGTSYFLPYYANHEHLKQIIEGVKQNKVGVIDRFLLLDNYILLQRGGVSATTELLELVKAYESEDSETVWSAITMSIAEARKLIEYDDKQDEYLDALVRKLVVPLADRLGWDDQDGDSAQTLRLRGLAVSLAAGAKHQPAIDEGLKRFQKFKKPSDLSPSTRGVVYFCGVRYGNDNDFARLVALHNEAQNADEKDELAAGLTSAKELKRYRQAIDLLKSEHVRRQDLLHWFAWLLRNRYSRQSAWQWMVDNWDWVEQEFSTDKNYSYLPRFCGSVFSKPDELKLFNNFFEPKKSEVALSRDILLGEQEINSRIAWRARNEDQVKTWLKHNH